LLSAEERNALIIFKESKASDSGVSETALLRKDNGSSPNAVWVGQIMLCHVHLWNTAIKKGMEKENKASKTVPEQKYCSGRKSGKLPGEICKPAQCEST
jgi:hypothetical protein